MSVRKGNLPFYKGLQKSLETRVGNLLKFVEWTNVIRQLPRGLLTVPTIAAHASAREKGAVNVHKVEQDTVLRMVVAAGVPMLGVKRLQGTGSFVRRKSENM